MQFHPSDANKQHNGFLCMAVNKSIVCASSGCWPSLLHSTMESGGYSVFYLTSACRLHVGSSYFFSAIFSTTKIVCQPTSIQVILQRFNTSNCHIASFPYQPNFLDFDTLPPPCDGTRFLSLCMSLTYILFAEVSSRFEDLMPPEPSLISPHSHAPIPPWKVPPRARSWAPPTPEAMNLPFTTADLA